MYWFLGGSGGTEQRSTSRYAHSFQKKLNHWDPFSSIVIHSNKMQRDKWILIVFLFVTLSLGVGGWIYFSSADHSWFFWAILTAALLFIHNASNISFFEGKNDNHHRMRRQPFFLLQTLSSFPLQHTVLRPLWWGRRSYILLYRPKYNSAGESAVYTPKI